MRLEVGSENRFTKFISKLGEEDRKALISHVSDLDGVVSAIVANKVIDADFLKFINYFELNDDLIEELKRKNINKVVFTDLFIKDRDFVERLEEFAEVLILDHHPVKEDWNSDKTIFIKVENGYCAGYLCYKLFGKIKNLDKLDWLVACSCISDYCHKKPGRWLSEIFEKYGDKFEIIGYYVRRDGKFWELVDLLSLAVIYFQHDLKKVFNSIGEDFEDIGDLRNYSKKVAEEIDESVEKFKERREEFSGGYLFRLDPKFGVGSIVNNILCRKEPDKIYMIMYQSKDGKRYGVSARRQDGKQDTAAFLGELMKGFKNCDYGGHVAASGGSFLKEDLLKFRERLGLN